MDKEEIRDLITEKSALSLKLYELEKKLVNAEAEYRYELERLWLKTDWDSVIDGRPTDKTKKAYVDAEARGYKDVTELLRAEIDFNKRAIMLVDDELKYFGGTDD